MSRSRFALPASGSGTRLPAVLALLLGALAAVQLLLPDPTDLPVGGAVARSGTGPAISIPLPVIANGRFAERGLFAPRAAANSAGPAPDPLGGAVFAGVVQTRGARYALVKMPDGQIRRVAAGGAIAGWRVTGFGPNAVRLRRGRESIELPYGQSASALGDPGDEESEEE